VLLTAKKVWTVCATLNGNQGSFTNTDDHNRRVELPRHNGGEGPSAFERIGMAMSSPREVVIEGLDRITAPPRLQRQHGGDLGQFIPRSRRRARLYLCDRVVFYVTIMLFWILMLVYIMYHLQHFRSHLSGTHGEWTRSDDVRTYTFLTKFEIAADGSNEITRLFRSSQADSVPEGTLTEWMITFHSEEAARTAITVRLYSERDLFHRADDRLFIDMVQEFTRSYANLAGVRRDRSSAHPRARAARQRPYLQCTIDRFNRPGVVQEIGGDSRYSFGLGTRPQRSRAEGGIGVDATVIPGRPGTPYVMMVGMGPNASLNGNNGSATNTDDHSTFVLDWADQLTTMAEDCTPRYVTHPLGDVKCAFDVDSSGNVYYVEVEEDEWMTRSRQSCVALLRQQLLRLDMLYRPRLDLGALQDPPGTAETATVGSGSRPGSVTPPPENMPELLEACFLNRERSLERRKQFEEESSERSYLPTASEYAEGFRYVPGTNHEVASQLNGSHGEYTNTDDLAAMAGGGGPGERPVTPPLPLELVVEKVEKVVPRREVDRKNPAPTGRSKSAKTPAPPVGAPKYDQAQDPGEPELNEPDEERMPLCKRFLAGECHRRFCKYRHGSETGAQLEQGFDPIQQAFKFLEPGVKEAYLLVYVEHSDIVYYHTGSAKTSKFGRLTNEHFEHDELGTVRSAIVGGDPFYCVKEGTIIKSSAKEWRYGTIVLAEGHYTRKVAQWFARSLHIPSYSVDSILRPAQKCWVHMHMLKNLRQYFTSARTEDRQIRTSLAHLQKEWCMVDATDLGTVDLQCDVKFKDELLLGTVHYFWYTIQAGQSGLKVPKSGVIAQQRLAVLDENPTFTRLWVRDYLGPAGEPWEAWPEDAPRLPYDMDPRSVFAFGPGTHPAGTPAVQEVEDQLTRLGVPVRYHRMINGVNVEKSMPIYTTLGERDRGDWKLHCWFRLETYGTQPAVLKNDTANMMVAMRRICGLRDNHEALTRNETSFYLACLALNPKFRHAAIAIDWPGVKKDLRLTEARSVRSHVPFDPVHQDVAIGMKKYLSRYCSRGAIRILLDNSATVVHVAGLILKKASIDMRSFLHAEFAFRTSLDSGVEAHRRLAAELPHIKRELRKRYVDGIKIHTTQKADTIVSHGTAKLKFEKMKYGKPGRLFVTYDDGCVAGLDVPALAKASISGIRMFEFGGITLIINTILKPDKELLRDNFVLMCEARNMVNTIAISNHGDDKIVSGNVCGLAFTYNADVKSCDSSHGRALFTLMQVAYQEIDEATGLILVDQCRKPIRVPNPANEKEYYDVYPSGKGEVRLGSGSPNTTFINSLATTAIAMAIASRFRRQSVSYGQTFIPMGHEDVEEVIRTAAQAVGYELSLTDCTVLGEFFPERMEFLKHFYCPETDQALMCPAAYLRNIGQMPGKPSAARLGWTEDEWDVADHHQIMHRAVSAVINGLKHEPGNVVLDVLRARFNDRSAPPLDRHCMPFSEMEDDPVNRAVHPSGGSGSCAPRVHKSILRRYRLTESELAELADVVAGIQTGHKIQTLAMSKMLEVDYGVSFEHSGDAREQHVAPPIGFRYLESADF